MYNIERAHKVLLIQLDAYKASHAIEIEAIKQLKAEKAELAATVTRLTAELAQARAALHAGEE